jgi:hypothetical protein
MSDKQLMFKHILPDCCQYTGPVAFLYNILTLTSCLYLYSHSVLKKQALTLKSVQVQSAYWHFCKQLSCQAQYAHAGVAVGAVQCLEGWTNRLQTADGQLTTPADVKA